MSTPMIIGEKEREGLKKLREIAAANQIDAMKLVQINQSPTAKRLHMDQINRQTMAIPLAYLVTYTEEFNQPGNRSVRHMTVSCDIADRVPTPEAVWLIAQELGYIGELSKCYVTIEDLLRGDKMTKSIGVIQYIETETAEAPQS